MALTKKKKDGTRLRYMQLFVDQAEEISMMDFRKRPGDVIDQVQMGKTFTITKMGRVVAILSQPEPSAVELGKAMRQLGSANY